MSYRDFQRQHPEWPVCLRGAVGRQVRLRHAMLTRGGTAFLAGAVVEIGHQHRGGLSLEDPTDRRRIIRAVRPWEVELLPRGDTLSPESAHA